MQPRSDLQNITTYSIVMENKRMVFPQRRPMGHRQQSDVEFRSVLHHHPLNIGWYQGCCLVQYSILQTWSVLQPGLVSLFTRGL